MMMMMKGKTGSVVLALSLDSTDPVVPTSGYHSAQIGLYEIIMAIQHGCAINVSVSLIDVMHAKSDQSIKLKNKESKTTYHELVLEV